MAANFRSAKPRSAFVICEAGSDIRSLLETLQKVELRVLNLEDALVADGPIVGSTLELIRSADIICAVLSETNSPNVYFELGFAQGLQRPLVVISETSTLPIELTVQLWIRASVGDSQALTFQIQAFLANMNVEHRRTRESSTSIKLSAPLRKLTSSDIPETKLERRP